MNTPKTRPYWHVDLKWMFGIMAFMSLWGALLLNAFAALSERDNATEITSSFVTSILKKNSVDVSGAIDQLRAQAAALPDDAVVSLPEMPAVKITKTELLTKTNEEIQSLAITQLMTPIYDQGLDKAATNFSEDKTEQQSFKKQAGILGVISKQTHDALVLTSRVALVSSLLWFAGLIYFSAGWGRLVSPGIVLLAVSPVGVALGGLLEYLGKLGRQSESIFGLLPQSVMTNLASVMNSTYRPAMFIGVGLLAAAGIGKLVSKNLPRKPSAKI